MRPLSLCIIIKLKARSPMFIFNRFLFTMMWRPLLRLIFFVVVFILEIFEAGERFLTRMGNIFNDSK